MGKKKSGNAGAKAQKKAKAAQKVEKKSQKKQGKSKAEAEDDDSDNDLEAILAKIQSDWEAAHTVTEELVQIPSQRANATLTACPNGQHLWCIGGEYFSEDGKAHFYNDVFRYSPEKNEWRKFVSPTCPGPRSAHAVVATPAGGGKLFLFGGEFSSLHQTNFFHYRDFWVFDIATHGWDKIETKGKLPSSRSGHRMAAWKHYIFLFGGFYDPGIRTKYLDDLWIFDILEYRWIEVEFKPNEIRPSARSGFSFLSTPDGLVLHGGYCKEYVKGKRPIGIMLEDTWFLRIQSDATSKTPPASSSKTQKGGTPSLPFTLKWERRKRPSTVYAPPLRSGATMTHWANRSMGIMFGGVTDEDTNEETLESIFWNDLNGYQWSGKGQWISLPLRKPKKGGVRGKQKKKQAAKLSRALDNEGGEENVDDDDDNETLVGLPTEELVMTRESQGTEDSDDPMLTIPPPRYNAMLAVLRNTLYIFGGIFERGSREYTMDDFYSIQLDKMDKYICIKSSEIVWGEGEESSSEDDEDEGDDDEESGSETEYGEYDSNNENESSIKVTPPTDIAELSPVKSLREQANALMGVSKDMPQRSEEDIISTPLPGETLAQFYARSKAHWAAKAASVTDNRGKMLRRDGFELAKERYDAYKPVLEEVEKILAEAGLDEEDMKQSAAGGGHQTTGSRHRR